MTYTKLSDDEVEETMTVKQRVSLRQLNEEIKMTEIEIAELTNRLKKLKTKRNAIKNILTPTVI